MSYTDKSPFSILPSKLSETQLSEARRLNNPNNEPVGDRTGRCRVCGSDNLWDDNLAYGCNYCGALLGTN